MKDLTELEKQTMLVLLNNELKHAENIVNQMSVYGDSCQMSNPEHSIIESHIKVLKRLIRRYSK